VWRAEEARVIVIRVDPASAISINADLGTRERVVWRLLQCATSHHGSAFGSKQAKTFDA
jgi:hypothetical protein